MPSKTINHPAERASGKKESTLPRAVQAYQSLLEAIKSGELAPGTRLREVELAVRLGISRTPLREALGRLESEGLLTNEANHGLVVTKLDHNMITELYQMREVLEGTAAGLAARHASDIEISVLRDIVERDTELLNDHAKLAANNRAFHDMLYRCAHNRYLLKTLNSLHESMSLLGRTTLSAPNRGQASAAEHMELVQALESRDAEAAEQIIRKHIRAAYKTRLSMTVEAGANPPAR